MGAIKTLKSIKVSDVDNELYILAYQWGMSSELLHIKGGNYHKDAVKFEVDGILNDGEWTVLIVGINWGGPAKFTVTYTYSDGTVRNINGPTPATQASGIVFTDEEKIRVE